MKIFRCYKLLLILLVGLIGLAGCGNNVLEGMSDDDSFEARLETARIALDDEYYSGAVNLLLDLQSDYPNNADVKAYLSNAYSGLAGLDTFKLLEVIDNLDDAGKSGSIDMVGLALGDEEGLLSVEMIEDKRDYFNSAIAALDSIADPNDDQLVQRGLLGLFRVSLIVGQTIINDTGQTAVRLTEDGIQEIYDGQESSDFDGDIDNEALADLSDDILAVERAVTVLDEDNDISEDFLEFKTDIDPNGDNWISTDELEAYVDDILND